MRTFAATSFKKKKKDEGSSFGVTINAFVAINTTIVVVPSPLLLKVVEVSLKEPSKSKEMDTRKK